MYDSGPASSSGGTEPGLLVLLHGWTSTAAINWYRCFEGLASAYRVVALDQRGHGRGVRSRTPFRLEDCADDAAALVETIGAGPATIVGYSMGGPVAQLMWKRHPEAVDGLVLCATAACFAHRQALSPAVRAVGFGASIALSLLPAALRQQGMGVAARRWGSRNGMAAWAVDERSRHDPSALMQAGLALARFDSTGWVGRIDAPTAVVITELDEVVPPALQRWLADTIPGATSFPVESDHRACADASGEFVAALLSACDSVRRGPAQLNVGPPS